MVAYYTAHKLCLGWGYLFFVGGTALKGLGLLRFLCISYRVQWNPPAQLRRDKRKEPPPEADSAPKCTESFFFQKTIAYQKEFARPRRILPSSHWTTAWDAPRNSIRKGWFWKKVKKKRERSPLSHAKGRKSWAEPEVTFPDPSLMFFPSLAPASSLCSAWSLWISIVHISWKRINRNLSMAWIFLSIERSISLSSSIFL